MKIYIKLSFLLLLPSLLFAQSGMVNNGAKIQVVGGTDVKIVSGGVINQADGEITNAGNIYLDNDWTQLGAATNYTGAGWMWFEGSTNQNISSVSALTVPQLRVDNGNRLILNSNIAVSSQVDLTNNGSIELGSNNLVVAAGATITNYDASNYIITNSTGILQQEVAAGSVFFPVGRTSYNPATLSNSGTTDNFRIRVTNQVLDNGTTGSPEIEDVVGRTWLIEEETVGGSLASLTVQWDASEELSNFTRSQCAITHWTGTAWDYAPTYTAATANGSYWTQTRNGLTSFSPFVVNDISESLPIELLSFEAERSSASKVDLDWITESETNNQGFDIERMLEGEASFTKIGWVDGNGTVVTTSYYNLEDDNAFSGVSYYRLKQHDFDGTIAYSEIRAVAGISQSAAIQIFPNPAGDYINIRIQAKIKEAFVQIFDSKGSLVLQRSKSLGADRLIQLNEIRDFADGVYMIRIVGENNLYFSQKFVKKQR